MKVDCLLCGHAFEFSGASRDEMGWHSECPACGGSFDVDITKYAVPNGVVVRFDYDKIGVIDGNDAEYSEEYEDINYYVCPIEHTHKEEWSDDYVMLRREEFKICRRNRSSKGKTMNKFSIREAENGLYLTEETNGGYVFGKEEDRIIFYDETEAESVLEYLNDATEYCCVLLNEDK